jgi:aryl-alcohol dehydrogenase-like predicted oxidoreductase
LERVEIGASGLKIAPLVLGGNVFGWTADQATSFAILDAFVDRGFEAIDTADVYARFAPGLEGGESETVIGDWLAQGGGRRERIVLCTKVGMEMGPGLKGLSAGYIESAVERSLKRLRTDRIDLYISHQDDPDTPLEETLHAYERLIRAGKVRAIGASNYSAERLAAALETSERTGLPRYQSLQTLYNLYDRSQYESGLEELCVRKGLSVFPYFALASGFLTGKYRSAADVEGKPRAALVHRYLDARGRRILAAMDAIAAERGVSMVQLALAWLLARPSVAAPVASATSLRQLEQLLAAVDLRLSPDELARLDSASEAGASA